jgi:isopenicillin-N N-acyltransferase like protein
VLNIQGDCSMYGAWGAATASTGKTFQLRALDWDTDGPFKDFSAVVVYHPSGPNGGNTFANVGFVAWIGALSGQSSAHMAISEIGNRFCLRVSP